MHTNNWASFSAAIISELSEVSQEILTHCFVTLNIIQHLVESSTPINQAPKSHVNQNPFTNPNASPIKQIRPAAIVQELTEVAKENRKFSNETDASSSTKIIGNFSDSHHYMRLYDNLRNIFLVRVP